jgi:hypothetical protein
MCHLLSPLAYEHLASAAEEPLTDNLTHNVSPDAHDSCSLIIAANIQASVVWHGNLWGQMPTTAA